MGYNSTRVQRGAARGLAGAAGTPANTAQKRCTGKKRLGFEAKDSLEAKALMSESFLSLSRFFTFFARVVSLPAVPVSNFPSRA